MAAQASFRFLKGFEVGQLLCDVERHARRKIGGPRRLDRTLRIRVTGEPG